MDLTEVIEKYSYEDYDEEVDGELYDYWVIFEIPRGIFCESYAKALKGKPIDANLRELLIVSFENERICDIEMKEGSFIFFISLLIRDRAGFEEAIEVLSGYPFFKGLESYWTDVTAFRKEDYVQPVPR